jgi:hypothetical protein
MIQLQKVLGSVRHECKYLVQERGDSKVTAVPQVLVKTSSPASPAVSAPWPLSAPKLALIINRRFVGLDTALNMFALLRIAA